MTVLIDIIAAAVIAGVMLVSIFGIMNNINQAHFEKTLSTSIQGNVIALARTMEYDFLKIGYHTTDDAIQMADSNSIIFKSDLQNINNVVSVSYCLGGPVLSTRNPYDYSLIRQVPGEEAMDASVGVTELQFMYFDSLGRQMACPITTKARLDSIKAIRIKIRLESPEPVYSPSTSAPVYQGVFWEKTVYPRNL